MLNIIYCEILKLKRSKIAPISVVGILSTPCLMFLEAFQTHFEHPEKVFTLSDIYENSLLYVMLLINFMVYVAVAAYLFSREYTEKTLKTILPAPVSRWAFIAGKFLMLYILTIILAVVTWAAILALMGAYHGIIGLEGFSLKIAGQWLLKFLLSSTLMFITISPFAYLAEKSKGFVTPIIASAVVVMGSAALCNQKIGAIYPWTAAFFLMEGRVSNTPYSVPLVIGVIALVSLMGFYFTFNYFSREDLK